MYSAKCHLIHILTVLVMKCHNPKTGETVLIRAYGKKSDLIIDRPQELVVNIIDTNHMYIFILEFI